MLPNCSAYHRPQNPAEALALLGDGEKRNVPLGGGTMLALSSHPGIGGLVDLSRALPKRLEDKGDEFEFSATATMTDLVRFFTGRPFATALLGRSAQNYLTRPVRNRATIGGVLAGSHGWAEVAAALLVLGARIRILRKEGEAVLPFEEALRGSIEKSLHGGFIEALILPKENLFGGSSRVAKTETDIPIVSAYAALRVEAKKIREARVALTGVNGGPVRARETEAALAGATPAEVDLEAAAAASLAGLEPGSDARASGAYRRRVLPVAVRRALEEACEAVESAGA